MSAHRNFGLANSPRVEFLPNGAVRFTNSPDRSPLDPGQCQPAGNAPLPAKLAGWPLVITIVLWAAIVVALYAIWAIADPVKPSPVHVLGKGDRLIAGARS